MASDSKAPRATSTLYADARGRTTKYVSIHDTQVMRVSTFVHWSAPPSKVLRACEEVFERLMAQRVTCTRFVASVADAGELTKFLRLMESLASHLLRRSEAAFTEERESVLCSLAEASDRGTEGSAILESFGRSSIQELRLLRLVGEFMDTKFSAVLRIVEWLGRMAMLFPYLPILNSADTQVALPCLSSLFMCDAPAGKTRELLDAYHRGVNRHYRTVEGSSVASAGYFPHARRFIDCIGVDRFVTTSVDKEAMDRDMKNNANLFIFALRVRHVNLVYSAMGALEQLGKKDFITASEYAQDPIRSSTPLVVLIGAPFAYTDAAADTADEAHTRTALYKEEESTRLWIMMQLMARNMCDPLLVDVSGKCALEWAVIRDSPDATAMLIVWSMELNGKAATNKACATLVNRYMDTPDGRLVQCLVAGATGDKERVQDVYRTMLSSNGTGTVYFYDYLTRLRDKLRDSESVH